MLNLSFTLTVVILRLVLSCVADHTKLCSSDQLAVSIFRRQVID